MDRREENNERDSGDQTEEAALTLKRWQKRTLFGLLLLLDSAVLGLLFHHGSLNGLNWIIGGSLPSDMIWLLQIVFSYLGGFSLIMVLFQDLPPGRSRRILQISSPLMIFILTLLIIELLFKGQDKTASITFNTTSILVSALLYSATYLSIAIGLTLTYKVQRYGNFAQSELFMVGMFVGLILGWSELYNPLYSAPGESVLTWTLLLRTLVLAFFLTGLVGVMLDRSVYRGFRIRKASPQVMMIASLGVALAIRAIYFMRFGSVRRIFAPDSDLQFRTNRWELPTTNFRLQLGDRSIEDGSSYTQFNCEQTGVDDSGEPILTRIVTEDSKPPLEIYDISIIDCVTPITSNQSYVRGIIPVVVFISVALLVILLNRTRLGMRMRAVADNPDLAASSGINVENVQLTSAFLSAGVTGVGGAVYATGVLFNPVSAFSLLLPAFAVIVLGTIGSVPGAIFASLLVGTVRALSSPILQGIGLPLGRSGYSVLGNVMPYIFLVAILMIMPKGIGDAWEKWRIDWTRKRKENTKQEPTKKSIAALAILPSGILGLHHLRSGRSDKAKNFSLVVVCSYVLHRCLGFIGKNSFSDQSCSGLCPTTESAETNLALLTGRNDGTIEATDSPYFSETVSSLDEKWLGLMETEIQFVNLATDLSEVIWPLVPILIWMFAIYQGMDILSDGKASSHLSRFKIFTNRDITVAAAKEKAILVTSPLFSFISRIDTEHSKAVSSLRGRLSKLFEAISSRISEIIRRGNPEIEENPISTLLGPYGRQGAKGSWATFLLLLAILLLTIFWLPISSDPESATWDKLYQVSNIMVVFAIFALMSFSLNLHTGYTGMVNFGVIFFVGIGAITVGILTAPKSMNGYGWGIWEASILAIVLSACFGWALAYPTARLRTDYFAIVTISLGEIVRILLSAEPLLRTGPTVSSIGIGNYPLPLKDWWFCGSGVDTGPGLEFISADACRLASPEMDSPASWFGELLNLGEPAPYSFMLASFSLILTFIVFVLLERVLSSPWGRILKAIREDEDVAQHHGHDVLRTKAASLAIGAGIAGLAGVLWAWKLTGLGPSFMSPASSTFLVWAAFVIGGAANNRGMIIGALIIVLMDYVFGVLVVASSPDLPLYNTANRIDDAFIWLVTEQWEVTKLFIAISVIGLVSRHRGILETGFWGAAIFGFTALMMDGQRALAPATNYAGEVTISGTGMSYVKLVLIGSLMIFSLKFNPKGMLPEVPSRPERPMEAVE